jgi:lipoate-protein ligase B
VGSECAPPSERAPTAEAGGEATTGGLGAADRSLLETSGLAVEWLGLQRYADGLARQREAVADRLAGRRGDRLLLLEHSPVVTLGRSTNRAHLKTDEVGLRARGIELFEVGRGGDVTYHAPGQLVGYPILDLDVPGRRDVHAHLRNLEAGLIDALEEIGVPTRRVPGWTGVFIDRARSAHRDGPERKIASIGVGVRRWVTFHGFALNVTVDLRGFDTIVPCGLSGVEMTSVAAELALAGGGADPALATLDLRVRELVGRTMAARLRP